MRVIAVEIKASTVVHILLTFDLINDLLGGSIAVLAEANVGCLPKLASALYNVFEWSSYVHIYANKHFPIINGILLCMHSLEVLVSCMYDIFERLMFSVR